MALMLIFMQHIDPEDISDNLLAFQAIDSDNNGQLDKEEMQRAVEALRAEVRDLDITHEDVEAVYEKLDLDNTKLLTYSQFIVATLDQDILEDERILEGLFKELDCFSEGFLTKYSFFVTLKRTIYPVSIETIEAVFEKMGLASDAKVHFAQFVELMAHDSDFS